MDGFSTSRFLMLTIGHNGNVKYLTLQGNGHGGSWQLNRCAYASGTDRKATLRCPHLLPVLREPQPMKLMNLSHWAVSRFFESPLEHPSDGCLLKSNPQHETPPAET